MRKVILIEQYPLVSIVMSELFNTIYPGCELTQYDSLDKIQTDDAFQCNTVVIDLYGTEAKQIETMNNVAEVFLHSKKIYISGLATSAVTEEAAKHQALCVSRSLPYKVILDKICAFDRTNESDFDTSKVRNEFQSHIRQPGAEKPLTHKQVEVMELCIQGMSGKEIAREMGLSPETVRAHLKQCYSRLNAKSRAQAVNNYALAKRISSRMFAEDEQMG